jgi:hypothetical protein
MAKVDFSDKFKGLKDKVANTEAPAPMQKIVPVKATNSRKKLDPTQDEPFTFWTTKDKMKALKKRAIDENTSVKDLINKALDAYLN